MRRMGGGGIRLRKSRCVVVLNVFDDWAVDCEKGIVDGLVENVVQGENDFPRIGFDGSRPIRRTNGIVFLVAEHLLRWIWLFAVACVQVWI